MTTKSLFELLKTTELPVAYRVFKDEQAPPFIVFYQEGTDNEFADNSVYKTINQWVVELYADNKNLALERKIEAVLPVWNKVESYINDEKLFQTAYYFEAVETEDD